MDFDELIFSLFVHDSSSNQRSSCDNTYCYGWNFLQEFIIIITADCLLCSFTLCIFVLPSTIKYQSRNAFQLLIQHRFSGYCETEYLLVINNETNNNDFVMYCAKRYFEGRFSHVSVKYICSLLFPIKNARVKSQSLQLNIVKQKKRCVVLVFYIFMSM